MKRLYNTTRKFLANHKKTSLFLSHGALHIIVLFILLISTIWMGWNIYKSSIPNAVVIDTSFKFLDDENLAAKSPITELKLNIRPGDQTDIVEIDINISHSNDSIDELPTVDISRVIWTWDNYYPMNDFNYRLNDIQGNYQDYHESVKVKERKTGFSIEWNKYWMFGLSNCSTNGNLLGGGDYKPYYSTFFKIDCGVFNLRESSEINVDLSNPRDPYEIITFDKIIPTPSQIGINKFSYKGKSAVESVLSNGGFYFDAKNTKKAYSAERRNLICNILLGTLIAFMLDIIIKLIYKWRRLDPHKTGSSQSDSNSEIDNFVSESESKSKSKSE